MIIDGKKIAAELREELKKKVAEIKSTYNSVPGLTVILVGEDAASKIYVKNKEFYTNFWFNRYISSYFDFTFNVS